VFLFCKKADSGNILLRVVVSPRLGKPWYLWDTTKNFNRFWSAELLKNQLEDKK